MTGCCVGDVYRIIDRFAPFETAVPGDNVGLLMGEMNRPVSNILTALDVTPAVVEEAKRLGAQLVVTHHPLMFSPIQRLDEAEPEAALLCEMVRCGLSMIAAHTNLDLAVGGVNDALAEQLGWPVASVDGFLRIGAWDSPQMLEDLRRSVSESLGAQVIRYGSPTERASRFAICSGSGGSEIAHASEFGAQVLLTGEIKHNQALEAMARGMTVLAAGHQATEICAADLLAKHLQDALNRVESKVRVFVSETDPFA